MDWHILGAGSIGCLWAYHLAKANHNVKLIVRNSERLEQFPGYISMTENNQTETAKVTAELADTPSKIDYLLVTTKAYDVESALSSVANRLHTNSHVILLHNGMGPQQRTSGSYPQQQIYWSTTTDGAWLKSPYHVVFAGRGTTLLANPAQLENQELTKQLSNIELNISHDSNIEQSLWRKLAINCAINPLTALYNCRNGELVDGAEREQKMEVICKEIEKLCLYIEQPLFDTSLINAARQVALATAENFSSMNQDIAKGRKTEIQQITGFICDQAERYQLHLPCNKSLLAEIASMESSYR